MNTEKHDAGQFQGIADHIVREIAALRAQRDELAAALQTLADEMQVVLSSGDPRPAKWFESRIRRARAALAKVQPQTE